MSKRLTVGHSAFTQLKDSSGFEKLFLDSSEPQIKLTTNAATVTMDQVRSGLEAAGLSKEDYTKALFNIQRAGGLM